MKKGNYIVSLLAAALGVFVLILSKDFKPVGDDPGPGLWPSILGSVLIGLAVLLLLTTIFSKKEFQKFHFKTPEFKHMICVTIAIVAYIAVMYVAGFIISTLIFTPISMLMLGERSWLKIAIFTVVLTGSIYVAFILLLKAPLPEAIFIH